MPLLLGVYKKTGDRILCEVVYYCTERKGLLKHECQKERGSQSAFLDNYKNQFIQNLNNKNFTMIYFTIRANYYFLNLNVNHRTNNIVQCLK